MISRRFLIAALASLCLCGIADASPGATPKLKAEPIPNPGDISVSVEDVRPHFQLFDGKVLDESRAHSLAASEDFELLAYHQCAGGGDQCAIFEVQGKRGKVFQYQVLADKCALKPQANAIDTDALTNPQVPPAGTAKTISPVGAQAKAQVNDAPNRPDLKGTELIQDDEDQKTADTCFGGYKVAFRARQENTFSAGDFGHILSTTQHYQVVYGGK
jgi:hypothetical protein